MNTAELNNLAWKTVRVRGLKWPEDVKLVKDVVAGTVKLDPAAVAAEVEASLTKYRLHPRCGDYVREYGAPVYGASIEAPLCHNCAKPMTCSGPNGHHEYHELSREQCKIRGIYHGGRCYHVEACGHCGHVYAYDSSD